MTSSPDVWFDIPITTNIVRGAYELEQTERGVLPHRLPQWVLDQIDDDRLAAAERRPAGVRLVFRTAATLIELDVLPTRMAVVGTPPQPVGVYDLMADGRLVGQDSADRGVTVTVNMTTGATTVEPGEPATVRFDGLSGAVQDLELWLPHNESAEIIAIRADARIEPPPTSERRVWVNYGSSISQGSNTTSPTTTWPALAAAGGGVELINLGFDGSALLDACIARLIRDTAADLISLEIGINVVNTDVMRQRAFAPAVHGFLDTIRDRHPDTPLLVVSPMYCPIHEITPGPLAFDLDALRNGQTRFLATGNPEEIAAGKLTLTVIRDALVSIVRKRQRTDPNLHYLDGRTLYGENDFVEIPLPDGLHPDTAGHCRIGERFRDLVFDSTGAFARHDCR